MHWADVYAGELLQRGKKHVIASGTSISGLIHIGNAGDIIIADALARAVREKGGEASVLWIIDDLDPLRSVPKDMPQEFAQHLGKPDAHLPCPWGHDHSFVEHFTKDFMRSLRQIGVSPVIVSEAEKYKAGAYDEEVRTALKSAGEIRRILKEISGAERAKEWLPFDPICESCGRIITTQADGFDGERIHYICKGGVAGKKEIKGCGHEGSAGIRDGKLTWRVQWAARWKRLGVTCEPFGKEHAAAGGSYDTCSAIVKDVFHYPPPHPIRYEHIMIDGKKMSKSVGNVVTLQQLIDVATPEVSRFFFFRTKANVHKDFSMENSVLPLVEEYEQAERVYFGKEEAFSDKEAPDIKRAYELAQVDKAPDSFFQVHFRHLLFVVQAGGDWEGTKRILSRGGYLQGITSDGEARLAVKAAAADRWVRTHAPEQMRFKLAETPPEIALIPEEVSALKALSGVLKDVKWEAGAIHDSVHGVGEKAGVAPKVVFQSLYKVLLGSERGPRLGYFLEALDREFVLERVGHFLAKD